MNNKTVVQYYIPEDGDDIEHPNVYTIDLKVSSVSVSAIRKSFPIPGTYYFRFKRVFKKTWIWFDASNDDDIVPSFDGSIIVKATRLPAAAAKAMEKKNNSSVDRKANPVTREIAVSASPKPVPAKSKQPVAAIVKESHSESPSVDDIFNSISPASPSNSTQHGTGEDVFSSFVFTSASPKAADPWSNISF